MSLEIPDDKTKLLIRQNTIKRTNSKTIVEDLIDGSPKMRKSTSHNGLTGKVTIDIKFGNSLDSRSLEALNGESPTRSLEQVVSKEKLDSQSSIATDNETHLAAIGVRVKFRENVLKMSKNHQRSMEMLNFRQVTRTNRPMFEETMESETDAEQSDPIPDSQANNTGSRILTTQVVAEPKPQGITEQTGYRPQRHLTISSPTKYDLIPSPNADKSKSFPLPDVTVTSPFSPAPQFRNTRMSTMNADPILSESDLKQAAVPKLFKDWYMFVLKAPTKESELPVRILDMAHEGKLAGMMYDDFTNPGIDMIVSGTHKSLLDSLIFPIAQDMSFAEVFLATYRFCIGAKELLSSLIGWYNVTSDGSTVNGAEAFLKKHRKAIQTRSLRVLMCWVRNHWSDFHESASLYAILDKFVVSLAKTAFGNNQNFIHAIREQRLQYFTYQYVPMFPISKVDGEVVKPLIFEWDGELFAHTLTMIVSYTATIIQKEDTPKKRTYAIKHFIKVAKLCLDSGDFNGAFAILYGLKRPTVLIWTQAWEGLPAKYFDLYKELNQLTDPAGGYRNYWIAIGHVNPPAVPFFVPYMQDLLYIYQNTPLYIDETEEISDPSLRQINVQKFYNMFSIAAELETFRLSSYPDDVKTVSDKEKTGYLVQHVMQTACQDEAALGTNIKFSTATVPDGNSNISGSVAMKNLKKISQMLQNYSKGDKSDKLEVNNDNKD
ncbi:Rap guanine nucleotide exchange factor 2 [Globomyces sp. JEL0801]|nr:Rap guanine nucleotide exchange factor 2 [Globomyces sp. JEL0801]